MKWILVGAILAALPLAAQDAAPAKNRRELLVKLVNDASTARSNATLNDEQKKQLDAALESLQTASAKRRKGDKADPAKTKESMKAIFQLAQSEAFKEDDRKKVREDLQAIRDFQQKRRKQN